MIDTINLNKMSVNDKLSLIEKIWTSLQYNKEEIKSPIWHKEILEERMDLINSGKANFISIEELKKFNNESISNYTS